MPCPSLASWLGEICDLTPAETWHCHRDVPEMGAWWKSSFHPRAQLPTPCAHPAVCFSSAARPAHRCSVPRALNQIGPRRSPGTWPHAHMTSASCHGHGQSRPLCREGGSRVQSSRIGWGCTALLGAGGQEQVSAGAAAPQVLPAAPVPSETP